MVCSRSRRAPVSIQALGAAIATSVCFTVGAQATQPDDQAPRHVETWSGGEAQQSIWAIYSGASWAPFAAVQKDGIRVRGVLGYGDYGSGMVSFGDLLVGYHKQLGPVT